MMHPTPETTMINGKPARWTSVIVAKWHEATKNLILADGDRVNSSNYFTPRPYVDEYNRGSDEEGFVYSTTRRKVFKTTFANGGTGA